MSEEWIVRHCAPTLAGLKAGSLFPCSYESLESLGQELAAFRAVLRPKGLQLLCIRRKPGQALIYLYRPSQLFRALKQGDAVRILSECGYRDLDPKACVSELFRRLQKDESQFPHEVGLFLGYPPEDVDGFIHKKTPHKCVGYWTVYGDEESAKRCFARYRKCTDVYVRQFQKGYSLDRLTVAARRERTFS